MAQYLMSVHMVDGEPIPPDEVMQKAYAAVEAFNEELKSGGQWVFAGGLHPVDTATVVAIGAHDEAIVTDGPFVEAKEHIAGFWVVEAADLDEALKLAEGGARACGGPVEVRPFQED